jgi:hypothetical protein
MSWIIFGMGVFVGTFMGVVVVALCQMAASARYRSISNRRTEYPYDSLHSPMLAKDAE